MTTTPYERPAASFENGTLSIRASQATRCQRQLYYAADGAPVDNPETPEAEARMEMGRLLEPLVLRMAEKKLHTNFHSCPPEIQSIAFDIIDQVEMRYTGIPDAWCEGRGGGPTLAEVKTRSAAAYRYVKDMGNAIAQPAAVSQLAIYRAMEGNEIDQDADCVILTLNKDTGELHDEWFSSSKLDEALQRTRLTTRRKINSWFEQEGPPAREHDIDSYECETCPWRNECWGPKVIDAAIRGIIPDVTEGEVIDALHEWEWMRLNQDVNAIDKNVDKHLRAALMGHAEKLRVNKMTLQGKEHQWVVSIRQKDSTKLNESKVRYLLTEQQYEDCLEFTEGKPYVEIRKGKAL